MITRAKIALEGIVQGVGFRPYIHRLSRNFHLPGRVFNTSSGLEIEVEGKRATIENFYKNLRENVPPLARIVKSSIRFLPAKGYTDFVIKESKIGASKTALISPDISICPDCLREMLEAKNKRYLYPFINCTNCGARFSIIKDLPYDRRFTTMREFKLCPECKSEFEDIENRRYHAQPNACAKCGPQVELLNNQAEKLSEGRIAIDKTAALLNKGAIVAIKGLGGFHIACSIKNFETINKLRRLKNRPFKPFALMVKDIEQARKICEVSDLERKILDSPERPIVLLKKKAVLRLRMASPSARSACSGQMVNMSNQSEAEPSEITAALAPRNNYLGLMLPYTPLHYLLFSSPEAVKQNLSGLVMTSANLADEPLEYDNKKAMSNLKKTCSHFLIHNRDIYNRIDDSIVQVINDTPVILRRARGYAPLPFILDKKFKIILACGGELKNTFCLTKGKFAFLSQYIGDLKTYKTFEFYKEAINRFVKLFAAKPEIVASDLHPDYLSSKYAQESAKRNHLKLINVQHHHAHIASVLAEHRIKENTIGICFDGVGYGADGRIWGGEFFTGSIKNLTRRAHLGYVPLPGGDKATQEPFRMAISYLYQTYGDNIYKLRIDFIEKHKTDIKNIIAAIKTAPALLTSSAGRMFDSVSALLGICDIITYEAQAAIELQMLAEKSQTLKSYIFQIKKQDGLFIIHSQNVFRSIIADIENKLPKQEIARKFHNGLANVSLDICKLLRRESNINSVSLSGGVFQNKLFSEALVSSLKRGDFKVYYHQLVPTNDGSISLGQAAIANEE